MTLNLNHIGVAERTQDMSKRKGIFKDGKKIILGAVTFIMLSFLTANTKVAAASLPSSPKPAVAVYDGVTATNSVKVKYQDDKGNPIESFKDEVISTSKIKVPQIPGYTFKSAQYADKPIDSKDNLIEITTPVADGILILTYTKDTVVDKREPIKGANVIVKYQAKDGNTLATEEVLSGNLGDGYISTAKEIPGYTLKTRPTNAVGFFDSVEQIVTYIYTKNGQTNSTDNESVVLPKDDKSSNKQQGHSQNCLPTGKKPTDSKTKITSNSTRGKGLNDPNNDHSAGKLPQTGINKQSQLSLLVAGIVLLLTGISLTSLKSKKKN